MNKEDITRMAQEAGLIGHIPKPWSHRESVERFAALVASAEREAILAVIGDNQCECRCSEVVRDRGKV